MENNKKDKKGFYWYDSHNHNIWKDSLHGYEQTYGEEIEEFVKKDFIIRVSPAPTYIG